MSRFRVFLVTTNVDPKAVATSDLCEAEVDQIIDYKESAQKKASLEFLVHWSDGEENWEKWEQTKN